MKPIGYTIFSVWFLGTAWAQPSSPQKGDKKKVSVTGIPIISYNSSYGVIVGANGMSFFKTSQKDTVSPASQAGMGIGYTENKSWFGSVFTQLYLQENQWRITAAMGMGDINFQYFEANNESEEGGFVDYSSVNRYAFVKVLRKIKGNVYGGGFLKLQNSKTVFDMDEESTQEVDANGLGITVLYDTRNQVYAPSKGWLSSASFLANPKWMGSDSVFTSLRAFANYYYQINPRSVLASRVSFYSGLGEVPFTGQHTVGGKDIRGYTNGKYRGNQVYAIQTEYRWNFYKRWGAVGFVGLAFTQMPRSGILPGGGIGFRFRAIPAKQINIGIDGALGKDDKGIYFRINEAF